MRWLSKRDPRALLELGAKQARLLNEGEERMVPIEQVRAGDHRPADLVSG